MSTPDVKELVREKYAQAALRVKSGERSRCCCGDDSAGSCDPITSNLYDETQQADVPAGAVLASLGCGNPTALAKLNPGEIVLDLGSGGGIDVLLYKSAIKILPRFVGRADKGADWTSGAAFMWPALSLYAILMSPRVFPSRSFLRMSPYPETTDLEALIQQSCVRVGIRGCLSDARAQTGSR